MVFHTRGDTIATARAHTNIALIKYWGKRNESLVLPMNSSLSLTLDKFYTTTTVQFCSHLSEDIFLLNGHLASESEQIKISHFLDHIRDKAGKKVFAVVNSKNKVPTAAGFASSASGFAALAASATKAIGLELDRTALSQIARLGSGSACRSIFGGYVEWQKGEQADGTDCLAKPVSEEQAWDLSVLSVLIEAKPKSVLSRDGMKRTVETSPFYTTWLDTIEDDFQRAKQAVIQRNFTQLGQVVEANALKMHATTLGADPPLIYWQSGTIAVMHHVHELRSSGIQAYFTIDAGPNVKVLCQPKDEQIIRESLLTLPVVHDVYMCRPGLGVTYLPVSSRRLKKYMIDKPAVGGTSEG